jgi:hypothetical protein
MACGEYSPLPISQLALLQRRDSWQDDRNLAILRDMRQLLAFIAFTVVFTLGPQAARAQDTSAPQVASKLQLTGAVFGIFVQDTAGNPVFKPAAVVPNVPNQIYGWVIRVQTNSDSVHVHEEFTLPKAPLTWGEAVPGVTQTISADGRTSVTDRLSPVQNGVILGPWTVAAGDPTGHYTIRVVVEDAPPQIFQFDVR